MPLLVSVDLQQQPGMPVLLQIALLAVATHVGPSTLSKCGSHGREQIWLLWGWGGCCIWVTFLSLGHCVGPEHRAALSWVLVGEGRCFGWLSTAPFLRAPCHQLTPELSWLRAGVPPSPSLLSCCCPRQAGASICLSPLPGKPSTFPPETTKSANVSGLCLLVLSPASFGRSAGHSVFGAAWAWGMEWDWRLTLGRAIKWTKEKYPSLAAVHVLSCICFMVRIPALVTFRSQS